MKAIRFLSPTPSVTTFHNLAWLRAVVAYVAARFATMDDPPWVAGDMKTAKCATVQSEDGWSCNGAYQG